MISRDDNATRVQAAEILTKGLLDVTNGAVTNAVLGFGLIKHLKCFTRWKNVMMMTGVILRRFTIKPGSISLQLYIERAVNLPWFSFDLGEIKEQFERAIAMLEEIAEDSRWIKIIVILPAIMRLWARCTRK